MTWIKTDWFSYSATPDAPLFRTNSGLNFLLLASPHPAQKAGRGGRLRELTENKDNICLTLASPSGMRQVPNMVFSTKVTSSKLCRYLWISLRQTQAYLRTCHLIPTGLLTCQDFCSFKQIVWVLLSIHICSLFSWVHFPFWVREVNFFLINFFRWLGKEKKIMKIFF